MEYIVRHMTRSRYLQDVSYSRHVVHLAPRPTTRQDIRSFDLTVTPAPAQRVRRSDYFGNRADWLALDEPHSLLEILAESRVAVTAPPPREPAESESWERVRGLLEKAGDTDAAEAVQFQFDSSLTAFTADVADYAIESFAPGRPLLEGAIDLMARIHADFRYDSTVTDASTPVDRVFAIRAGVCQDLAHMGIAAMRSLGLSARYVSGYLLTHPPPGKPRLVGADASHAWFSVWAPPFGWVDLDPTNNLLPHDEHIVLGWGRDYGDVAPMHGVVTGGGDHIIEVGVDVAPVPAANSLPSGN
jgi:transglutaminase-like putative cysteine protease